jgi:chemotaxis receptor (MCP) glutamine deamidase CheD
MKFKLLLLILGQKLKKASKNIPAFKDFIKGKNIKVLMKTADGKQGRAFTHRLRIFQMPMPLLYGQTVTQLSK